nr:hypothetical protein [uncultured Amphritea sp.]
MNRYKVIKCCAASNLSGELNVNIGKVVKAIHLPSVNVAVIFVGPLGIHKIKVPVNGCR